MTLSRVISHFELSLNSNEGHDGSLIGELVVVDETWEKRAGMQRGKIQAWF